MDKLVSALDYLGLKPNIDEYEWRFRIQKLTFILKALGFGIDFNFHLHKEGPYSQDLMEDYYGNKSSYNNLRSSYSLNESDIKTLEKVRQSINPEFASHGLMEGTATALFFFVKDNSELDEVKLRTQMKREKSHLSDSEITLSINNVKKLTFKQEYLSHEIKEEIALWENLGIQTVRESN